MKIICQDCGISPVNHKIKYWSIVIDWFFQPFYWPSDRAWRKLGYRAELLVLDYLMAKFLYLSARLGLFSIRNIFDAQDELMLQCIWEEAIKRGVKIEQFILFNGRRGVCLAHYQEKVFCFDRLPRPPIISQSIDWLDNKEILKNKLVGAGIPVAFGEAVFSLASAKKVFLGLEKPVIVKPHIGSGSRHTTMHIIDEGGLMGAFKSAKQLSPRVIIEEELIGAVYRITSVGGKIIGVIRRDQPQIIGTGQATIKSLIEKENTNSKRLGPIFSKILVNEETDQELKRQNLTLMDIPKMGQVVTLHPKINWSLGGTTTDVTDLVHHDNMKLFERITSFLGDPLIGIDFIIADITQSWVDQKRCGVIECNSLPFIDNHHFPFNGQPRNVAGAIWDLIFPK